jgi:hypothetical protein
MALGSAVARYNPDDDVGIMEKIQFFEASLNFETENIEPFRQNPA